MKYMFFIILIFTLMSFTKADEPKKNEFPKAKLVLQLIVDQLRGDIINKHRDNFSKDGFKFLLDNGLNFTNAHYLHGITKTAPGHASIATGSIPAYHGIVNNSWYDVKNGKGVYSCEDSLSKVLSNKGLAKRGVSPKNLLATTLSDEIHFATQGESKIFGISVKDRGAIFLAGHQGKSFWYSSKDGMFVTSQYYYDQLPGYVAEWNDKDLSTSYYNSGWQLLDGKDYKFIDEDENLHEKSKSGLGKTFPHKFDNLSKKEFFAVVPYTPWGDRLTLEFAKEVITKENIGKDDIVDYLSISFSCTDYIGHLFGPNTLEYEDQILNLDKVLSELFSFIDAEIGLENVLICLTADHGVCDSPDFLKEKNIPTGVVESAEIVKACNTFGKEKLQIDYNLVERNINPYLYLNEKSINSSGLSFEKIKNDLADLIAQGKGIYKVYTDTEIQATADPSDPVFTKVKYSYHVRRSGHLYIVAEPNWYLGVRNETRGNAATHGSPWTYDTFVPLIFCGPGIQPGQNSQVASPQDISVSISNYLKIKMPSASVGNVLIGK